MTSPINLTCNPGKVCMSRKSDHFHLTVYSSSFVRQHGRNAQDLLCMCKVLVLRAADYNFAAQRDLDEAFSKVEVQNYLSMAGTPKKHYSPKYWSSGH